MEEIDENSLEFARKFKKFLRFDVGEIVYLKSDLKKKCAMHVMKIMFLNRDDDDDYYCEWMTSQKEVKRDGFLDKCLYQ